MALGGKTVQYTLAVDLETGELTAGTSKVKAELNALQRQTKNTDGSMLDFARSAKQLKSELSLLFLGSFGGYALAVGVLTDAIKETGDAIRETFGEKAIPKEFINSVGEFIKTTKEGFQTGGDKAEVISNMRLQLSMQTELNQLENERARLNRETASQSWWKLMFGSAGASMFVNDLTKNTIDLTGGIAELQKTIAGFDASNLKAELESLQWQQNQKDFSDWLDKLNEQFKTDNDKAWAEFIRKRKEEISKQIVPELMLFKSMGEQADQVFKPAKLSFAPGDTFGATRGGVVGGGLIQDAKNARDAASATRELAEANYLLAPSFQNAVPLLDLVPSKLDMVRTTMSALASGFAEGFAAIGAAVVNGTNGFKGFGAVFLKMIAQLAVQFGTFMILTGMAANAAPFLGLSGSAAIAAGVALTVFGGALGAIASKMGGNSGGGAASEREQRFRDSRFGTNGGNGGTTIINNINFANTIGLTRDSMKEVGEIISKELFKQEKLGRIETVG